jgi:hypothetical protein
VPEVLQGRHDSHRLPLSLPIQAIVAPLVFGAYEVHFL